MTQPVGGPLYDGGVGNGNGNGDGNGDGDGDGNGDGNGDGDGSGKSGAPRTPASGRGELRTYVLAGVGYVGLALLVKQVLAWWTYGAAFLLLAVWLVPEWLTRWRARRGR